MLKVEHVYKKYDDLEVLKDVSLEVDKGDVITIIGPSGSGKTTLLRCINFLTIADSGKMIFDDKTLDMAEASKKEMNEIRKKTAFVFQNYNLFLSKTALQNVIEGLSIARKIPKDQAEVIAKKALDKVGLSDRYDYYPTQLSGGQQQRVGIARAIASSPEIILFDEPTSALDPISTSKIEDLVLELKKDYTIVIVTHNMQQAARISDYTAFFLLGEVVEMDKTDKIFSTPSDKRTENYITGRFG